MAITTLDGVVAGMQWPRFISKAAPAGTAVLGKPMSYWTLAGFPGAGAVNATLAGVALSSTAAQVSGQIDFRDPTSGNSYLARLQGCATTTGTLILADRLWHNGGFTVSLTTAQTVNSAAFPARDNTGTINGEGVLLGVELSAAATVGTPTITVTYTNSAGTTTRSGTNLFPTTATAGIGSFLPISLQAGDIGVKSVQSLQLSAAWTSSVPGLVAYRPLAALELTAAFVPNAIDALTSGMPRLFNGSVPFFIFIPSTATLCTLQGQVVWTQG